MEETGLKTYTEREIQSQAETSKVYDGEWQPLCRYEMFDVIYWPDEEGKPGPKQKLSARSSGQLSSETHPNMTSMLPRLSID